MNIQNANIREIARVLGLTVSSFSAVEYGKLYYREIEKEKISALKDLHGNFESLMKITSEMKEDLKRWVSKVFDEHRVIRDQSPKFTIQTYASNDGWGAVVGKKSTGGRWLAEELDNHINTLEMMAVYFAWKAFVSDIRNEDILILSDNTSTVSYISNMDGIMSTSCNRVSTQIWLFCRKHTTCIWLSASTFLVSKTS